MCAPMLEKLNPPTAATGTSDSADLPSPSALLPSEPQQNAAPAVLRPQAWLSPVVIASACTGTDDPATTADTVTTAVPDTPSLVAVMVAEPAATPVTTPDAETVAFVASDDVHVTVRPVSVAPPASFVVAASVAVAPTLIAAVDGDTVTLATGTGATVNANVPVFPSDVAVIVTAPGAIAVTNPVADTVARPASDDDHVIVRPVSTAPLASFVTAVSCAVPPTVTVAAGAVTDTVETATTPTGA